MNTHATKKKKKEIGRGGFPLDDFGSPLFDYGVFMKMRRTVAFCVFVSVPAVTVMTVFPKPTIIFEVIVAVPPAAIVGIVPEDAFPRMMMPPARSMPHETFVAATAPLFSMTAFTLNNPPVIAPISMVGPAVMVMACAGDQPLSASLLSFALTFTL